MDARFLLDTDTCIYVRRRRPPGVMAKFQELKPGETVLSVITFGELLYGAAKSPQSAKAYLELQEFSGLIPVLPLPADAGRAYACHSCRAGSQGRNDRL